MIELVLLLLTAAVSLVASAFFSGIETGLLSVSRERILHLAREGGRRARRVQRVLTNMGRATTTILIGNNLANVTYSTASTAIIFFLFSNDTARSAACFVSACLVLYLSEFLPKLFFSSRPLRRTLKFIPIYHTFDVLLSPLATIVMKITDLFIKSGEKRRKLTRNDLLVILQDRKDGVRLTDFESALITRIITTRMKGEKVSRETIYDVILTQDA